MNKLTDIIEAATPGPWRFESPWADWNLQRAYVFAGDPAFALVNLHVPNSPFDHEADLGTPNARFIATFDPEHIALMEAVCEAAKDAVRQCRKAHYWATCDHCGIRGECDEYTTVHALEAYREERGLL